MNLVDKDLVSFTNVSFEMFTEFLLHQAQNKNRSFDSVSNLPPEAIHWWPYSEQCGVCRVKYDLIGHMETFNDDAADYEKPFQMTNNKKRPPPHENDENVKANDEASNDCDKSNLEFHPLNDNIVAEEEMEEEDEMKTENEDEIIVHKETTNDQLVWIMPKEQAKPKKKNKRKKKLEKI